jgi:hypothetical protein
MFAFTPWLKIKRNQQLSCCTLSVKTVIILYYKRLKCVVLVVIVVVVVIGVVVGVCVP